MLGLTLPLALIGVGFFIHFLFRAASYALPLLVGLFAGFAAMHAGISGAGALLLAAAAFMAVIAVARMATLLLPSGYARAAVALLFAVPAAIAGFQVASALSHYAGAGVSGTVAATMVALATGIVAAKRLGITSQT